LRITHVRIENFRCIKQLDLDLDETTVLIGPNNEGKSAILDALRLVLTRRWGQRGTGFTEYDIHLPDTMANAKSSPGAVIEIECKEVVPGEWPQSLQNDLDTVIQADPQTNLSSIKLRVTYAWNANEGAFEPKWDFLNTARQPLPGRLGRRVNLDPFWQYLPVFYLGPLRDADDEFTSRSQFWGRLLKAMKIPPQLESRAAKVLAALNTKFLTADPRLAQIAQTVGTMTQVAARDQPGALDLRMMPLESWDLLSRAQIILRNDPNHPWLPLGRHGQGLQSLSVIFLFHAFVNQLLANDYGPDSAPVLLLEEPETHLHPQAARTLLAHIRTLPGQKVLSTHSPYFLQRLPFRALRLVSLTQHGTQVRWLPPSFSTEAPSVPSLSGVLATHPELRCVPASSTLTVHGPLSKSAYRDLLVAYVSHPDRQTIHASLRDLRDRAKLFVSDAELSDLETFARRIRGEIFFARRWFLVEGQAEFHLVHALGRALGYDLDEHGTAVIDAQNNGNPAIFAVLARALGIPWIGVFDGDLAGKTFVIQIARRAFERAEILRRCHCLRAGKLEDQLLHDGCEPELRDVLLTLGYSDSLSINRAELEKRLDKNKVAYAAELAARIEIRQDLVEKMPSLFRNAITALSQLT
jgi:putative ATP-dependent endonuclease of OLD family